MGRRQANLLELEIGALVCNALVSDTELARGRRGGLHLWDGAGLHRGWAEWRGCRSAQREKRRSQARGGQDVTLITRSRRHRNKRHAVVFDTLDAHRTQHGASGGTITQPPQLTIQRLARNSISYYTHKSDKHTHTHSFLLQNHQSSVILSCSNGIGSNVSRSMPRERSSGMHCGGTSCRFSSGRTESSVSTHQSPALACHVHNLPSRVKLNKGGNSFWLGILAPSPRNSSKKGCTIASTALNRAPGVYSRSFATKSIASGAVRGRKTYKMPSDTPRARTPRTNLVEWMGFDLRKLVLHVVGIHRLDLLPGRCAKNLDNLHQLIDTALTREQWLAQHQLRHDTTRRPYVCLANASNTPHAFWRSLTDVCGVVCGSENELWCAVVPRANITDVGLARHENLC